MVLRKFASISVFFATMLIFSCEKVPIIKCSDCLDAEPTEAEVTYKLDPAALTTDVTIYEGDIEDNVIYAIFRNFSNADATIKLPINKNYTFSAVYTYQYIKGKYIAVDSAFPRVKYDESTCDNPCYFIYDNKVNLIIKYH